MKNQLKSLKINNENQWKSTKINENQWESIVSNYFSMILNDFQCFLMVLMVFSHFRNLQKFGAGGHQFGAGVSMKINKKQWKSTKINENQWKSIKIYENPWKSM